MHETMTQTPAKPMQGSWLVQYNSEVRCRKNGGHHWHPDNGMIDWFCCMCGAECDGAPKDGPNGHPGEIEGNLFAWAADKVMTFRAFVRAMLWKEADRG